VQKIQWDQRALRIFLADRIRWRYGGEFGVANAQAATGRHGNVDAVRDKKRSMETDFCHGPWLAIAFDRMLKASTDVMFVSNRNQWNMYFWLHLLAETVSVAWVENLPPLLVSTCFALSDLPETGHRRAGAS
jgi:hypothetical protein